MDNLTHALVGLLIGETASRVLPAREGGVPAKLKRNAIVGVAVIGSNLPDMDFIYSTLTGSKLDYLLHHRGHTHTVVGAMLAALLMLAVCEFWWRRQQRPVVASDRWQVLAVSLLAALLHIALDYTNSYGVHPFWPLYNGWLYGDSVFIVEPLLWVIAAPLIFILHTRIARIAVALAVTAAVVLSFATGMVPWQFATGLLALTLLLLGLGKFTAPRTALFAGIASWAAITATFAFASHVAGSRIDRMAASLFPQMTTLDHVLSPMPVNPVCWEMVLVQSDALDLVLRRATFSLLPALIPAGRCTDRTAAKITAPMRPSNQANTAEIQWTGDVTTSRAALRDLVATRCVAAGLMQFARAPWATRSVAAKDKSEWVIGDLRYDREPSLAFAEFSLAAEQRCPRHVPPWVPPRDDVLRR